MRKYLCIILLLLISLFVSCNNDLSQPVTNLEFWLCDNVDDVDFSNYDIKYGMMGGTEYYGTGYIPEIIDGEQVDPDKCVLYTVTSYPDYSSKGNHITRITITDPEVEFYSLSLNSTHDDIKTELSKQGFVFELLYDNTLLAKKNKYTFSFNENIITLRVEVTNKYGIEF